MTRLLLECLVLGAGGVGLYWLCGWLDARLEERAREKLRKMPDRVQSLNR